MYGTQYWRCYLFEAVEDSWRFQPNSEFSNILNQATEKSLQASAVEQDFDAPLIRVNATIQKKKKKKTNPSERKEGARKKVKRDLLGRRLSRKTFNRLKNSFVIWLEGRHLYIVNAVNIKRKSCQWIPSLPIYNAALNYNQARHQSEAEFWKMTAIHFVATVASRDESCPETNGLADAPPSHDCAICDN